MHESTSNVEGIKKATGTGFRKHISEYDSEIIVIPLGDFVGRKVLYETKELTSVCPLSGLPDFYHLKIEIEPSGKVPELKSLKFYLMAYRDVGILHEDLAVKIAYDIYDKVKPNNLYLWLKANTRGGIDTEVEVRLPE